MRKWGTPMHLPVNYNNLHFMERREVREEYIRIQKGLCYYCGVSLSKESVDKRPIKESLFPDNFFKWPVHLHHSHKTRMTIGAVHNKCNAVLWQYEEE